MKPLSRHAVVFFLSVLTSAGAVQAQQQQQAPEVVATGSATVSVGGKAVARKGDGTTGTSVVSEGASNVRINGKPAARAGDKTNCGGVIVGGSSSVFVNGKPLATSQSSIVGC